eukprot:4438243-Lingulodinium_polyedra.AAC.1
MCAAVSRPTHAPPPATAASAAHCRARRALTPYSDEGASAGLNFERSHTSKTTRLAPIWTA